MAKRIKKLRAYGYVRVSTDEQAKEGLSLDAQEEKIRTYAVDHSSSPQQETSQKIDSDRNL